MQGREGGQGLAAPGTQRNLPQEQGGSAGGTVAASPPHAARLFVALQLDFALPL